MSRLEDNVVAVLTQRCLEHVCFQYRGLAVIPHQYLGVAALVRSGKISCGVGVPQVGGTGTGANRLVTRAMYIPNAPAQAGLSPDLYRENQFRFPSDNYARFPEFHEMRNVVHEATHAIFDVYLRKRCPAAHDELAANLAAALYALSSPYPIPDAILVGSAFDEALKLAVRVLDENRGNRLYNVAPEMAASLERAVRAEWGLTGGSADIVSVYNGVP